jgi:L-alanine-DL-glutamate epimerase-like enolase superfamily enzyme
MKIVNATVTQFCIPLNTPLSVLSGSKHVNFPERRGLHFRISCECSIPESDPVEGVGELVEPVFTLQDTPEYILEQTRGILQRTTQSVVGTVFQLQGWVESVRGLIDHFIPLENLPWVILARFCIEQALLRVVADALGSPLHIVIAAWLKIAQSSPPVRLRLNTMFNTRISQLPQSPSLVGVVKLKVGGGSRSPEQEAAVVSQVAGGLRGTLRLDANQSWSVDEAGRFASSLSEQAIGAIEYIEEPLRVSSAPDVGSCISELRTKYPIWNNITIALDESLLSPGIADTLNADPSLLVVHKTFLLGLRDCALLHRFRSRTTFSCTFETGVGLSFLAAVAAAGRPDKAHGLFPLQDMVAADPATADFSNRIMSDNNGAYIDLV